MSNEHSGIALRERLLRELDLKLVRVFDTSEHEPNKDVCLVKDSEGQAWVLRSGERRDPALFPEGFVGEHFVIPAMHKTSEEPMYELEEFLHGDLVMDVDEAPNTAFPNADVLKRIFGAFWEWQEMGNRAPLKPQETHFDKHLHSALVRISEDCQRSVLTAIDRNRLFFDDLTHPSKWKFADDNLVLMEGGRIGFIDNARMGLRFWGYDMGWVYWPRWFRLSEDAWQNPASYIASLQVFFDAWYASKPANVVLDRATFDLWVHLGLLTRLVGALYDVEERISHAERWLNTEEKRLLFTSFITDLLDWNLTHITSS